MKIDAERFAWRTLADSTVVLDLRGAEYFALEGVAAELWERLCVGADRAGLIEHLTAAYEVDEAVVAGDVDGFLADLQARCALIEE